MRLKLLATNGQRDPQWASTLLGYNTSSLYTIGSHGCLITSFGNYIGKNPLEVNTTLKTNGGYSAGSGNFIWSHCTDLGLKQVYQSPYYADAVSPQGLTKMKAFLDAGQPLITHIDFDPRDPDDDQHWILVCGYDGDAFFALDPWTGTYINLDVYGGVARAVLEYRVYDKILMPESGVTVPVESSVFENLVRKSTITDKVAAKLNVEVSEDVILADIDKMLGLEDVVVQKDRQLTEVQERVAKLEADITKKETDLATTQSALNGLIKQVDALVDENTGFKDQIEQLKKDCKVPTLKGWKLGLWKWLQTQG